MSWLRRRGSEFTWPAAGWLSRAGLACVVGELLTAGLTLAYSGTSYRNELPRGYNLLYGNDRPFAPSLARTSTNGALTHARWQAPNLRFKRLHTQIYDEWKPSAHPYAAMDPIFQGIQTVMAKQNGPESTRYRAAATTRSRYSPGPRISLWTT